ncbi:MAG TPA: carboxypeptidase-like regulatory domain-containing protein [Gemmatimonadales bacterium]|nr:carboxypeptidase-like regulatory domain-containing protein [Gemmatimonadales bacterium]
MPRLASRTLPLILALAGCGPAVRSTVELESHGRPLMTTGPDAVALPVDDRYRYGVVVGSVVTTSGERGCNGEVWLQPDGAPVRDVRSIAPARLQNMFRFPQLLPGRYELGIRCLGFHPVRQKVRVRIGQVIRAVVTMSPLPSRATALSP